MRIRYAKRGPLRFTSHRDFARAFERAVRRADIPVAFSQGFSPHPKISYASAAPTGVASEAEYLEIGLREPVDPSDLRKRLDDALSPGLDVLDAVQAGGPSLADRIDASRWRIEVPAVTGPAGDGPVTPTQAHDLLEAAVAAFLAAPQVLVERMTKQGRRQFDARGAVVSLEVVGRHVDSPPDAGGGMECAILESVVRQVTPSVRPDDVLAGLRVVSHLELPVPPRAIRLAQGRLTVQGEIVDPLVAVGETSIGETSIEESSE